MSVKYNDEDGCLYGKVLGLHGTLNSCEDNSMEEINEDFEGAVDDDYCRSCEERDITSIKPYREKLNLRLLSEQYAAIPLAAYSSGTSINDFTNSTMSSIMNLPIAK